MELFGLKDGCGKEYKLTIDDPNDIFSILKIGDISEVKTEPIPVLRPEYKAGNWVYTNLTPPMRRIYVNIDGQIYLDYMNGNNQLGSGRSFGFRIIKRHATPKEIEAHLRKICDDKYIGKRVKCLEDGKTFEAGQFCEYDKTSDSVTYESSNDWDMVVVYRQGKFADIIPDKKPLPKSKEELREIIIDFCKLAGYSYSYIDELLEDIQD